MMKSKKLVVFLFPDCHFVTAQNEYFKEKIDPNFNVSNIFDAIIQKRYIDKGYEFAVATYLNSAITGIEIIPDKIVYTDLSHDYFYKNHDQLMERYLQLAQKIDPKDYSKIKVGGYHLGDCVDKFTMAINMINNVASIDKELTNEFPDYVFNRYLTDYNQAYEFYNEIILNQNNKRI